MKKFTLYHLLIVVLSLIGVKQSYGLQSDSVKTNWIAGVGVQPSDSEFFLYDESLSTADVICIDGIEYNFIRTAHIKNNPERPADTQYLYRLADYKNHKLWLGFIGKCISNEVLVNKNLMPEWWLISNPTLNNVNNIPIPDMDGNGKPEIIRITDVEEETISQAQVFEFNGKSFEVIDSECAGGCISLLNFEREPKESNWVSSINFNKGNHYFTYTIPRYWGKERPELLNTGDICINGDTFEFKRISQVFTKYRRSQSIYEVLNFTSEKNWAGYIGSCTSGSQPEPEEKPIIQLDESQILQNQKYEKMKQVLILYASRIAKLDSNEKVATPEFREELSRQYLSKKLNIITKVRHKVSTFGNNYYTQECVEYRVKMSEGWRTFAYTEAETVTVHKFKFYGKYGDSLKYIEHKSEEDPCIWDRVTDYDKNNLPEIIRFENKYNRNKGKFDSSIVEFDGGLFQPIFYDCSGICF